MKIFIFFITFSLIVLQTPAHVITGGIQQIEDKDKITAYFSDGTSAVRYKNIPLVVLYYNEEGFLTHTEKRTSIEYPYKSYKYNTEGNLVTTTMRLSEDETLIYNRNGKLIAHWRGTNCYDNYGNIIMTRKFAD